jgi:hypothetical protein
MDTASSLILRLWQLSELHPEPVPQPNFSSKYLTLIGQ